MKSVFIISTFFFGVWGIIFGLKIILSVIKTEYFNIFGLKSILPELVWLVGYSYIATNSFFEIVKLIK